MDELQRLARDLTSASNLAPRVARRVIGRGVDAIAKDARQIALSSWTRYGRGTQGAAGSIRARMARGTSGDPTGYVLGDDAAFFQEVGTVRHAAQPAIMPAADKHESAIVDALAKAAGDML